MAKIYPASQSFPPRAPNFLRTTHNEPVGPIILRLLFCMFFVTFAFVILLSILFDLFTTLINILALLVPPTTALISYLTTVLTFGPIPLLLNVLSTLTTLLLIDHTLWYTTALATYIIWRNAPLAAGQHLSHAEVAKVYVVYAVVYFCLLWCWCGTLGWIGREGWVMGVVRGVLGFEGVVGGGVFLLLELGEG